MDNKCNIDALERNRLDHSIPTGIIKLWKLRDGSFQLTDHLYGSRNKMIITASEGKVKMKLHPLESLVLKIE